MLPILSARWALNDAQAGHLFTAQFAGSMAGVALSGWLVQRYGYRSAIVAGLGTMAAGVALLAQSSLAATTTATATTTAAVGNSMLGIAAVAGYGIGLGLAIPASNLLIAEMHPDRRAAALNWLNFSWGAGAAACPFAVAALAPARHTSWLLFGSAAASILIGGALLSPSLVLANAKLLPNADRSSSASPPASSPWRDRYVLLMGCLFFLYVGTENSIGGWIASYAQRIQSLPGTLWAAAPALFWGGLLAGRALAPSLLRGIHEKTLAQLGLLLALCGVGTLLAAHNFAAHSMEILLLGVAISGLGLAPVFPINISLVSLHFRENAPRVSGLMFALAGLGGAILPGLVGTISSRYGSLQTGLVLPLLGALLMLLLLSSIQPPGQNSFPEP